MSSQEIAQVDSQGKLEETPVVEENIETSVVSSSSNLKEPSVEKSGDEEKGEEDIDDLFGDEDEDEENDNLKSNSDRDSNGDNDDEDEDAVKVSRRRGGDIDEEEEMYNRKFYGDDIGNYSEHEDEHSFKESEVELVRHIIPYKTRNENEEDNTIYYAKVPTFLTIDPVPFDPINFENKVKDRLANSLSREDKIGDGLIDENTVRWRYSRDENQRVYKESNAQIVQWSDGSYSLKVGDEYTDVLVNDTDNTFLAISHDQQELMQCFEGGEVAKTLMFIPTSTNSKIHQRLSKAVARRDERESAGPGTYIINMDPEVEKRELEKKQSQIMRDRRRRQMKERENLDSPDTAIDLNSSFGRRSSPQVQRRSRVDEYEDDGFMVDDEDDEQDFIEDDEEDDELVDEEDDAEEEEEEEKDEANAERLRNMKREGAAIYDEDTKRRKVAVIADDEDE